jgi:hypothetical protein
MFIEEIVEDVGLTASKMVNKHGCSEIKHRINITYYYLCVSTAGASGQMNSGWAASAGEAVVSDCGESAGHMGAFLAIFSISCNQQTFLHISHSKNLSTENDSLQNNINQL